MHYRRIGAGALLVCVAAVGLSVTACMMKPEVAAAVPEIAGTALANVTAKTPASPETAAVAAPAVGLPNLNDPANSPRFLCPVQYEYVSCPMSESHRGDDLAAEQGTPVYAAADGTVTEAIYHYSWGNFVQLDHGTGPDGCHWTTLYSHLDSYTVEPGQRVQAGELIGYVGSTGYSTGSHLHLEVKADGTLVSPCAVMACREADRQPLTGEMVEAIRTGKSFAQVEMLLPDASIS